jgi:glycosyltransferase involved in cell wall biosynthesis
MLNASVIICTHNPRANYLRRVLDALRRQTLPKSAWELLLIDNASDERLAPSWDISWHPNARHLVETELGLTPARLRGMREAASDVLVFVDDDNVLEESYLSEVKKLAREWPILGVWGSGNIQPEFEVEPPVHLRKFLRHLALRDISAPYWSNVSACSEASPVGAGLCVRSSVGAIYRQWCKESIIQINDRQGKSLSSGGDDEIGFVACTKGYGMGVFPQLKLTHLIPRERISQGYLERLIESYTTDNCIMDYKCRGIDLGFSRSVKMFLSTVRSMMVDNNVDRRMQFARVRGFIRAQRIVHAHKGPRLDL